MGNNNENLNCIICKEVVDRRTDKVITLWHPNLLMRGPNTYWHINITLGIILSSISISTWEKISLASFDQPFQFPKKILYHKLQTLLTIQLRCNDSIICSASRNCRFPRSNHSITTFYVYQQWCKTAFNRWTTLILGEQIQITQMNSATCLHSMASWGVLLAWISKDNIMFFQIDVKSQYLRIKAPDLPQNYINYGILCRNVHVEIEIFTYFIFCNFLTGTYIFFGGTTMTAKLAKLINHESFHVYTM